MKRMAFESRDVEINISLPFSAVGAFHHQRFGKCTQALGAGHKGHRVSAFCFGEVQPLRFVYFATQKHQAEDHQREPCNMEGRIDLSGPVGGAQNHSSTHKRDQWPPPDPKFCSLHHSHSDCVRTPSIEGPDHNASAMVIIADTKFSPCDQPEPSPWFFFPSAPSPRSLTVFPPTKLCHQSLDRDYSRVAVFSFFDLSALSLTFLDPYQQFILTSIF
jgi:hypothetical protein